MNEPATLAIDIDYAERQRNEERYRNPHGYEPCFICGRPVNPRTGWQVHLRNDGTLFPTRNDLGHWQRPDSQGAFPLGSECAKRVPLAYRIRIS